MGYFPGCEEGCHYPEGTFLHRSTCVRVRNPPARSPGPFPHPSALTYTDPVASGPPLKCPDLELVALRPWAGERSQGTLPSKAKLKSMCSRSWLRPFLPPSFPSHGSHPLMAYVDPALSWLNALIRKEPGQPWPSHSLTLLMVSPLTQVHSPTCYWKCSLRAQSCMESPSHPSPSPHPTSKDVHRGRRAKDWPPTGGSSPCLCTFSPTPGMPLCTHCLMLQELEAAGAEPGAHLSILGEKGQPLGPGNELGSGQSLSTDCHNW